MATSQFPNEELTRINEFDKEIQSLASNHSLVKLSFNFDQLQKSLDSINKQIHEQGNQIKEIKDTFDSKAS